MLLRRCLQSNYLAYSSVRFKDSVIYGLGGGRQGASALFSTDTAESRDATNKADKTDKKLSNAMKAYLERARAYTAFIQKEESEYNIGKRHLANMVGQDPETFTQQQVDEAIEYLFPSGLFEKKARPLMKMPKEIFPPKKDAQFDESGRPFHYLFYTGKPNFYSLLHDVAENLKYLNSLEDKLLAKNVEPKLKPLVLEGTDWVSKAELKLKIVEDLSDRDYSNFLVSIERLANHRLSYEIKDFIMNLRKPLMDTSMAFEIPEPSLDSEGRKFICTKDCPRKSARADVTVRSPGTGIISINGQDIEFFKTTQARNQILFPLELTGLLGSIDVEATVSGGGETGKAGAVRWGISWGLRSFVSSDMVETMRLAGLLTRDFRRRERKKPGQAKARRKFTWKKR